MSSNDAQSNQSQNKPQPGQQKPASGQQAPGQQKPATPNQTSPANKPNPAAGSAMNNDGKVSHGKDAANDKSGTDANKSTGADHNRSDKDHAQTR